MFLLKIVVKILLGKFLEIDRESCSCDVEKFRTLFFLQNF